MSNLHNQLGLYPLPTSIKIEEKANDIQSDSSTWKKVVIYLKKSFKDNNYESVSEKTFLIANQFRHKLENILPSIHIECKSTIQENDSHNVKKPNELHIILEIDSRKDVYEQSFSDILTTASPAYDSTHPLYLHLQSQSYILRIGESISICGFGPSGLFYGTNTLLQLFEYHLYQHNKICLQGMIIRDFPQIIHRGVMLDISRDKVPKMETLYLLIDQLASWKINQVQLYMEHTFAYEGHEEVWKNASPMTPQEILELDHYCKERFIQLVPNQNSFGHMHRWLIHEKYRDLAEVPEGINHGFSKAPEPFTLCPTDPKVFTFIEDLFDQLLPNFSVREINVGMDETFDLGQGKSKAECEKIGLGTVYANYLKKVYAIAKERGFRIQFWGDIILHHEQSIRDLPKDAVALIWGYEGTHPFDKQCQAFLKNNIPFYVCPGTSSWNSVLGRTDNCIENLMNAALNGVKYGAEGYLITDWGDHGHFQPFCVSLLGFFVGAALSWNTQSPIDQLQHYLNIHVFHDKQGKMGEITYSLGNLYTITGEHLHTNGTVFGRMLAFPDTPFPSFPAEQYIQKLLALKEMIEHSQIQRSDTAQIKKELQIACDMILFSAHLAEQRLAHKSDTKGLPKHTRTKLAEELSAIIPAYSQSWLNRNRPGGLFDSAARLQDTVNLLSE